jgi:holo-[acyl-carrier protein] synthase
VKRARIDSAVARWGRRFLDRIFTPVEQRYCQKFRDPALHLAGRFAIKEAVFKALGTGWSRGVQWKEIETTNDPSGQPRVAVTGRVKALLNEAGGDTIFATISHDTDYSIGSVVITRRPQRPARRRRKGAT